MRPIRIALVGAGSMAAHHARVITASPVAHLAVVVDHVVERAAGLALGAGAVATDDLGLAFGCDAAIVATASMAHAESALPLIARGMAVLVEKPMATELADVQRMVDASLRIGSVLMCGFVERFNPSLAPLRGYEMRHNTRIVSVRVGPPPQRVHSGVVDDLLVHDLDLVLRLVGECGPTELLVEPSDWNPDHGGPDSIHVELTFENGSRATLQASWASSSKIRSMTVRGDDLEQRVDFLAARDGQPDGLTSQLLHFAHLAQEGTAAERTQERDSILPAHVLAHRIMDEMRGATCIR